MEKFEKKLHDKILTFFNNAKEWSDLITTLKELKNLIKNYETKNISLSNIKDRITLSKRMAQCLNPILPKGLHKEAISTYNMILKIILKENNNYLGDNLGLYLNGLFPYFPKANLPNKIQFVDEIIEEIFLQLKRTELELCLPGFLAGVLPGLEEQNAEFLSKLKNCFNKLQEIVTKEIFYGTLWSVIIRNHKVRLPGMSYMIETVPLFKNYITLNEEDKNNYIKNYYPKINTLVINTLCAIIEDSNVQIVRLGMDFIITRLPLLIENTIINKEQKKSLLISGLKLLEQNEYTVTRRLLQWLIGENITEEVKDSSNPEIVNVIELLINAFKCLFKEVECNSERLIKNIKILESLLNQQGNLIDRILDKVVFELANSVVYYWTNSLHQSEYVENDRAIQKVNSFFNNNSNFCDCLWKSMGEYLEKYTLEKNVTYDEKVYKLTNLLKFCLLNISLSSDIKKIEHFTPIISNLLVFMTKIEICEDMEEIKKLRNIILLTLVFTKTFQQDSENKRAIGEKIEKDKDKDKEESLTLKKTLTIAMNQGISEKIGNIEQIQKKFQIAQNGSMEFILSKRKYTDKIKRLTESVLIYQKYYVKIVGELLKYEYFEKGEIKMFQQATELLIRTEEYAQQRNVPEWVIYLEKLTFLGNTQISLEASSYLLEMLILDMKNPIYKKIAEYILTNEINQLLIKKDYLNQLIQITKGAKTCAELLMARLWILLDEQKYQLNVIDLLIKFSKANNEIFINIISNTFYENKNVDNFDTNIKAIKKFSQFWKLTNELYPEEIFFEKGQCLFTMLSFLEHENPMVRHLTKSWLNQSVLLNFNKILDPLLGELFSVDSAWSIEEEMRKIIFIKEYDDKKIMAAFKMLKNIIINTTTSAINYMHNKVSENLLEKDKFGYTINNELENYIPRGSYLELMVNVSLRFIMGKMSKDISLNFNKKNYAVQAASCEFLEFLLGFIEPKSTLLEIAIYITEPVLEILFECLDAKDEVMEVQVLNLLRVLLITPQEEHKKHSKKSRDLFMHQLLIGCLVRGLEVDYFFVREHFLSFIESILPVFNVILPPKNILCIALMLITTTSHLIFSRVKYKKEGKKDTHLFSHFDKGHNDFIYKNYLKEYAEYKTYDENDILSIIKTLKEILFCFLHIQTPSSSDSENWGEMRMNLLKGLKEPNAFEIFFIESLKFSSSDDENKIDKTSINNLDSLLQNLISALLTAWINESDEFVPYDYCINDNGILTYKEVNENYIEKNEIDKEKESEIKPLIIQILYNIFIQDPVQCMSHFLQFWSNSLNKENKDKQYKLSLLELLISMKIPLQIFLICIRAVLTSQIKEKLTKGKNKNNLTKYEDSVSESKILHFIYSYILLLNDFNKTKEKNDYDINNNRDIWSEIMLIISFFYENSKISYTYCWLMETINLMLIKIPIINESNKKELTNFVMGINKKLMDISFLEKFESSYESDELITLPVLPSIYTSVVREKFKHIDLYQKSLELLHRKSKKRSSNLLQRIEEQDSNMFDNNENIKIDQGIYTEQDSSNEREFSDVQIGKVNLFYLEYYNIVIKNKRLPPNTLQEIYRKISFLTIKNTLNSIINNLFSDKQREITKLYGNLIECLIKTMKQDLTINNKSFYTELSTEFLQCLMKDYSIYTWIGGKQVIMDYFFNESFFITNPKMIRFWKEIINHLASHYSGDIITDLLNSIGSNPLFTKCSDSSRRKKLRRLSFVIYSCKKDKFSGKLNIIKEKVKDLLTTYSESSVLEEEIFLMIRVLFLRFSNENTMEIIKMLWPIIFSELVLIMQKKKKNNSVFLILEVFKFIEFFSLANIEEFTLYQWLFIIDTFDTKRLDTTDSCSLMSSLLNEEEKVFKPMAMKVTDDWGNSEEMIIGGNKGKNELVIIQKGENNKLEEELIYLVKKFFYSIGDMTNYKVSVNYEQIEEIIESDFLNINNSDSN